jgi:TetR/AcrR family fatty acid metabolism transcriptional regulator
MVNDMDKKTLIINAAVKVFAEQGLNKGKIADIAKEAGIGKGTVYEYFRSKEDIFSAIETMFISGTIEQLQAIAASNKPPTKKIEEICQISLDLHNQLGDSVLIISELWAQHSRGLFHGHSTTIFRQMYHDYYKIIEDMLKEGMHNKEFRKMSIEGVTTMLLSMIDGVIWQSVIFRDDKEFNHRKNEAIKAFMNGIKI